MASKKNENIYPHGWFIVVSSLKLNKYPLKHGVWSMTFFWGSFNYVSFREAIQLENTEFPKNGNGKERSEFHPMDAMNKGFLRHCENGKFRQHLNKKPRKKLLLWAIKPERRWPLNNNESKPMKDPYTSLIVGLKLTCLMFGKGSKKYQEHFPK